MFAFSESTNSAFENLVCIINFKKQCDGFDSINFVYVSRIKQIPMDEIFYLAPSVLKT